MQEIKLRENPSVKQNTVIQSTALILYPNPYYA